MANTRAPEHVTGCEDPRLSKYYMVIVQYAARLNSEKVGGHTDAGPAARQRS